MNKFLLLITLLVVIGLGSSAHAIVPKARTEYQQETMVVKSQEGEYVGTVANALVDGSGNITFIILSIGGKMGQRKKEVAVPLGAFLYDRRNRSLILNIDRERLAIAPEFNLSNLNDPLFAERLYQFFGEAPAWSE